MCQINKNKASSDEEKEIDKQEGMQGREREKIKKL